jgi:hypothetical protein
MLPSLTLRVLLALVRGTTYATPRVSEGSAERVFEVTAGDRS